MTEDKKNEKPAAVKPAPAKPAPAKPAPAKPARAKSAEEPDDKQSATWSTGAKFGAAIGSAAVAAALIYAGRHQMKKHDDFKAAKDKPLPKYENEPDYDEDEGEDDPQ